MESGLPALLDLSQSSWLPLKLSGGAARVEAWQAPSPAPPNTVSIADALGVLLNDNLSHGGQTAYLRGYYRGMGWYR